MFIFIFWTEHNPLRSDEFYRKETMCLKKNYYFSISIYKPINCVLIRYFQLNLYISAYQRTETNCPLDCRYVAAFLIQKNQQTELFVDFFPSHADKK